MRVAISYDIASDRARTRVASYLEGYAERVQRSVFEGEMPVRLLAELRRKLRRVHLGPDDSIRYYLLCETCGEKVVIDGAGSLVRAPKHFIV